MNRTGLPVFKVQQIECDTCGNTWTAVPPIYVEASSQEAVEAHLATLPRGFFHWHVEPIMIVDLTTVRHQ